MTTGTIVDRYHSICNALHDGKCSCRGGTYCIRIENMTHAFNEEVPIEEVVEIEKRRMNTNRLVDDMDWWFIP